MGKFDDLYTELENDILNLENHFLKSYFDAYLQDPTIDDPNELNLYAYSLISHAKLEHFFEKVAELILDECHNHWKENRRALMPILCLLAHWDELVGSKNLKNTSYKPKSRLDPKNKRMKPAIDFLNESIDRLIDQQKSHIKRNNGIKEQDFSMLFRPVGLDRIYLDTVKIGSMDSFGKYRGEIAHNATSGYRSPHSIKSWINDCLELAKMLVSEVNELINSPTQEIPVKL